MQTFSVREIQSMLKISRSVIGSLIGSGFVTPARGRRNEYRFTFQDVVLLRTAYGLRSASIAPRKILRSLRHLRATLPAEMPLTGLRITAVGSDVAVQEGAARRDLESGQLLFDFDVEPGPASVVTLQREPEVEPGTRDDWFERGVAEEPHDKAQAEAAYRRAIALAPGQPDAYLNLGVLLVDQGRSGEAVELYRRGLLHCPVEALLHFNLAVALEDVEGAEAALERYEACLRLAPKFADAHYNAARLHEQLGHRSLAIRHYSEYRRLQR